MHSAILLLYSHYNTFKGADVCNYEKPAPCGGMKQEDPEVSFEPGEEITVTFQKNLDHFNSGGPGYFEVSFWGADFPNGTSLIKVPDSADIKTLEVWNVNVTLPKLTKPEPKGILQLVYSTNNPNAPPFFYQCADIHLMKKM
jgi:hypothetical protein